VTFDRWAANLFALLLIVVGLGAIVVVAATEAPPGARLLVLAGLPAGGAVLVAADWGLSRGRGWARPLAVVMLWALVISGMVRFVAALGTTLTIPLEAIGAAFVLSRAPAGAGTLPAPQGERRIVLVGAAIFIVASFWPMLSTMLLRSGASPFAVGDDAIVVTVAAGCSGARDDAGIRADVTWTWNARDLMPGSTDGLLVEWATTDGGIPPSIDREASTWPEAAQPGSASPSAALIQPFEAAAGISAETFRIDNWLGNQADGRMTLVLRQRDDAPHGAITIDAVYAHLDRWTVQSRPAVCSW
jgi:hypothetical protein